jgi:hypothetical protein
VATHGEPPVRGVQGGDGEVITHVEVMGRCDVRRDQGGQRPFGVERMGGVDEQTRDGRLAVGLLPIQGRVGEVGAPT